MKKNMGNEIVKRLMIAIALMFVGLASYATSTTYTFTSTAWKSKVGTITTDGKTDGWVSILNASDYNAGYKDAQGRIYSCGVGVKTGSTGAGAESVLEFVNVRSIVVNLCQNSSKGKGAVNMKVGDNEAKSVSITRPAESGTGQYNRDIEFTFDNESGKVSFTVDCTENGIYINTITIKADNGSDNNPGATTTLFKLVTDVNELENGDEVMFGVAKAGTNYVMGLYDEANSKNNIFAVKAVYDTDRQYVNEKPEAIYTVEKLENGMAFIDATGWYLVASGGNPNKGNNNYLTIWDNPVSPSYGDYGIWDVSISADGTASVKSMGVSRSCYIQFNENGANAHPIFACYSDEQYAHPALYKRQEATDVTKPIIQANFINFGTQLIEEDSLTGEKSVTVTAYNLTEDIEATLKDGSVFSLNLSKIDRDGEELTVSFKVSEPGYYTDTLVLSSGGTSLELSVILSVEKRISISEAKKLADLTTCWLNPVVVTKKYNRYIFVEDETGGMLLYDGGNLYSKDIVNGNVLTNVCGYKKDYYGNPEISLTEQFKSDTGTQRAPTLISEELADSDICRYVRMENVSLTSGGEALVWEGDTVPFYDLFNYIGTSRYSDSKQYNIEGIVYYYEGYTLCPTSIEIVEEVQKIPEDVNQDGEVNSLDVLKIYKYMQTSTEKEEGVIEDVNGDGDVNSLDVLKVYKYMQSH